MNKIKIFEAFAGIGANSKALTNLGIDHEIVGYSEIDKHASKSFAAIHGVSEELNFGDITKIDKLPCEIDLLTGGFPCQPFSNAGKGLGIIDQRGLLALDMVRIAKFNKPKVIIAENVKGLLSPKHKQLLDLYISELEKIGYNSSYKLLNAIESGIPQGRKRVFIVSFLGDKKFDFSNLKTRELKPLNEFIDFNDFSWALDNERLEKIRNWNSYTKPIERIIDESCTKTPTITTRGNFQMTSSIKLIKTNNIVDYDENGDFIRVKQATKKGYIEAPLKSVIDLSYPSSKTRRGRVPQKENTTGTITATQNLSVINAPLIRPIYPKECFRLMGFDNQDFEKAKKVCSLNQLGKQAGNSIVVDVLEMIYEELYGGSNETNNN